MKILVMTTKSPYPLFEGRALRTYNLIKQAAEHHEIHLLSFVQTQEDLEGIEHMRQICSVVEYEKLYFDESRRDILKDAVAELFSRAPLPVVKYRTAAMREKLRRLIVENRYDLIHLDMLHLAEYVEICGDIPIVLVEHNVEHVILDRRAANESRWWARRYLRYQAAKLKAYESRACARVGHVVSVSELDAQQLRALASSATITAVPNGVDTDYFKAEGRAKRRSNLVFVGGFTWFPNLDAIGYFCDEILPRLLALVPDLSLTVIGKHPDAPAVQRIAQHAQVELVGQVDDIRPYVDEAQAYVVPLRIGGGTRLKILDAFAMSQTIISTSVGCEGLAVAHDQSIVIADTPDDFAQAVAKVLRDRHFAERVGRQGRQLVESQYDWRAVAKTLLKVYERAHEQRKKRQHDGP
ncbi:MAG: glycosyltransferase [Burkholderiales bacterium]|nr:glycosyltransferase [Burkholderiales bacterium]